jgi:hypothetical protein
VSPPVPRQFGWLWRERGYIEGQNIAAKQIALTIAPNVLARADRDDQINLGFSIFDFS